MSVFISKKLKETRSKAGISQEEASKKMGISERRMRSIEANQSEVSADEIIGFAKLYKVDVRELILESYVDEKEEQILCNRYASFLRLFDQLSDRDKEDVIWVIKQRISGAL
jgi:transcriptional regulator with XRE-family HTH domain